MTIEPAPAAGLSSESAGASSIYHELASALVKTQDERKASIEQRGLAVITTSGAFVTLLFAVVGLVTKEESFSLPRTANGPLAIGMILFVVAGIAGLLTNLPFSGYKNADEKGLDDVVDKHWSRSKEDAEMRVYVMRKKIYAAASTVNGRKAIVLIVAMVCEVAAIACVGLALTEVMRAG